VLTTPEEREAPPAAAAAGDTAGRGVRIAMRDVLVRAGGHTLIDDVSVVIEPGSHVGIVGSSGAGKSTLVGLLLGWHTPAAGAITVDEEPLDSAALRRLRAETAWVDPSVQLWNASLLTNLTYGNDPGDALPMDRVVAGAELQHILRGLPDGLQSTLGDGGSLVSGGEGQRVRFGRAMGRGKARLVILDEPFRGLPRPQREAFLDRARRLWAGATLLCVTHDLQATKTLDRVLVVEGGRIVEDGAPADLAATAGSRYARLLAAEVELGDTLWSDAVWRRLVVQDGQLRARTPTGARE